MAYCLETYKAPSDIIQPISYVDDDGLPLDFNNLIGYGIYVYCSGFGKIGKWGVGLDGFTENPSVFEITGINTINLNLSELEYKTARGVVKCELYIEYVDPSFEDGNRLLVSETKELFKIN